MYVCSVPNWDLIFIDFEIFFFFFIIFCSTIECLWYIDFEILILFFYWNATGMFALKLQGNLDLTKCQGTREIGVIKLIISRVRYIEILFHTF